MPSLIVGGNSAFCGVDLLFISENAERLSMKLDQFVFFFNVLTFKYYLLVSVLLIRAITFNVTGPISKINIY